MSFMGFLSFLKLPLFSLGRNVSIWKKQLHNKYFYPNHSIWQSQCLPYREHLLSHVWYPTQKVQPGSEGLGGIFVSTNSICLGIEVAQQVSDEPDLESCPGQRVKLTNVGKFSTPSHKLLLLEPSAKGQKCWKDQWNVKRWNKSGGTNELYMEEYISDKNLYQLHSVFKESKKYMIKILLGRKKIRGL